MRSKQSCPNVEVAKEHAKKQLWKQGSTDFFKTTAHDMSGLGVGFQLYFTLLDKLSLLFLALTALSFPSIIANASGTAVPTVSIDTFYFAVFTLGNQGTGCEIDSKDEGSHRSSIFGMTCNIPCDDESSQCILGTAISSTTVSYVLTFCEGVTFILLVWFVHFSLPNSIKMFKSIRDSMVPSAARYTVFVRGLPPDVTKVEVADFFSERYDLAKRQPSFPLGVSEEGIRRLVFQFIALVAFAVSLAHSVVTGINITDMALEEGGIGYIPMSIK